MISVVILTKNSAVYLPRCLQALLRFEEVLVIDNGSEDDTLAIAAGFANVTIYQREFCGFGPLKNIGASLASNDWVLFVDSDEIVSSTLVNTLLGLSLASDTVYRVYRKNYYANLLIDGCSWDNDYVGRLYHRGKTSFNANQVHESIQTDGLQIRQLSPQEGVIYHFPYRNTAQLINKLEHYARLYAEKSFAKKKVRLWTIPLRGLLAFIKSYILKKGFKYGYEGLVISSYNAMGVLVKYLKLYELSQQSKLALALPIEENLQQLDQLVANLNQQLRLAEEVVLLIPARLLDDVGAARILKLKQELITPCRIIAVTEQDHELVLTDYLQNNPQLDGVILYAVGELFNNKRLHQISHQQFCRKEPLSNATLFAQKKSCASDIP